MPPGPPPSAYQPERRQLAEALRLLRRRAGLTGDKLAERAGQGWQQSKVSKIENLRTFPTEEDIRTWVSVTGASDTDLAALLGRLERARVEYAAFSTAYRDAGVAGMQRNILELEARMTRIAEFQPAMVPGLVQTADYADATMSSPCGPPAFGATGEEIRDTVNVRMQRQEALYDASKKVTVIIGEGGLRHRVAPPWILTAQLDRLIDYAALPGIEFGIVPFDALLSVPPLAGFRLYDDLVIIEHLAGEQELAEPDEVARYERALDLLREASATGPMAVQVIRGVRDRFAEGPAGGFGT